MSSDSSVKLTSLAVKHSITLSPQQSNNLSAYEHDEMCTALAIIAHRIQELKAQQHVGTKPNDQGRCETT